MRVDPDYARAQHMDDLGKRVVELLGSEPDLEIVAGVLGSTIGCLGLAHGKGLELLALAHATACGVLNGTLLTDNMP